MKGCMWGFLGEQSKESSQQRGLAWVPWTSNTPSPRPKLGVPHRGSVESFFQLFCWNPHSERDGVLGSREGSGEPPRKQPRVGTRAPRPSA